MDINEYLETLIIAYIRYLLQQADCAPEGDLVAEGLKEQAAEWNALLLRVNKDGESLTWQVMDSPSLDHLFRFARRNRISGTSVPDVKTPQCISCYRWLGYEAADKFL